MYINKVTGYIEPYITKGLLDTFEPVTQESINWKRWVTHSRRNSHRLYYSNDGLIFVSYDHGNTFYEII